MADERLKAFISSTVHDLINERAEVARRLEELNVEPVFAGNLSPNGTGSWDRLEPAVEECDLFVLILGERYGWIPTAGPKADANKSVTELELEVARAAGLPVLVFMKRLDARMAGDESDDARRRDRFRAEIEEWDGGLFRAEFELARDLADSVGRAVARLISDQFRAAQLKERRARRPLTPPAGGPAPPAPPLPNSLVEAAAARDVVLLLGAGASLEAGMPSAAMFIEAMATEIAAASPDYAPGLSGTAFNAVATDFESLRGTEELRELAAELVEPGFTEPTEAHRIAGRLFDTILTTNYDLLLERGIAEGTGGFTVIDGEARDDDLEAPLRVIKLHGSIDRPRDLVLTEAELANLERQRPTLWAALVELLSTRPLLSIGSSLRDPSLIRLLEESRPDLRGWAVIHDSTPAERRRLQRWNLETVAGDANGVLAELERLVARFRAKRS